MYGLHSDFYIDYTLTLIVDMSLILGECYSNFRVAARLYDRYPNRRHPNNIVRIALFRQGRIDRIHKRQGSNEITELVVLDAVAVEPTINII